MVGYAALRSRGVLLSRYDAQAIALLDSPACEFLLSASQRVNTAPSTHQQLPLTSIGSHAGKPIQTLLVEAGERLLFDVDEDAPKHAQEELALLLALKNKLSQPL